MGIRQRYFEWFLGVVWRVELTVPCLSNVTRMIWLSSYLWLFLLRRKKGWMNQWLHTQSGNPPNFKYAQIDTNSRVVHGHINERWKWAQADGQPELYLIDLAMWILSSTFLHVNPGFSCHFSLSISWKTQGFFVGYLLKYSKGCVCFWIQEYCGIFDYCCFPVRPPMFYGTWINGMMFGACLKVSNRKDDVLQKIACSPYTKGRRYWLSWVSQNLAPTCTKHCTW